MSKVNLTVLAILCLSALPAFSQARLKKITVLPLKDRTGSGIRMNISEKAADALLSKLAETGKFMVVERESLASLQSEKNLKFDADFNPANAPKNGLMAVCDFLVTGQIDEFSANESTHESGIYISKKTETDGTTALKLTVRVTSTETGEIIASPSVRVEKSGVLGKSSTSTLVPNVSSKNNTADINSALLKLVDAEIEDISTQLATKIAASYVAGGGVVAKVAPVLPKFVGMEGELAVINKGSTSGIKSGDSFDVVRPTDTGMKDPDTSQPIIRRKKVCTVVISQVEEGISEGACAGGTPQKGDEIRAVSK